MSFSLTSSNLSQGCSWFRRRGVLEHPMVDISMLCTYVPMDGHGKQSLEEVRVKIGFS